MLAFLFRQLGIFSPSLFHGGVWSDIIIVCDVEQSDTQRQR